MDLLVDDPGYSLFYRLTNPDLQTITINPNEAKKVCLEEMVESIQV